MLKRQIPECMRGALLRAARRRCRRTTPQHEEPDQLLRDLPLIVGVIVREAVEKMQAEFKERDEEMDHKFNLQVAENKRLQGHIGELKKENKHLCRTRVPRGPAAAAPPLRRQPACF